MLLKVEDLETKFFTDEGIVEAVRKVSFSLKPRRTLGIVGESGCGKTVLALSILRLLPFPGKVVGGKVIFNGRSLLEMPERELRKIRGGQIAMIFQDPMTSLNPVLKVGYQVTESILAHQSLSRKEARQKAIELLQKVGIPQPLEAFKSYPHQFSGGMRQRAMIAMALANNPLILIADEPTTALDVTIQAQILELINKLRSELNSSVVLITHDMGVVAQLADEVLVMYAGKVMEVGPSSNIFYNSRHPYTWGLMSSVPRLDRRSKLSSIKGAPPSLISPPTGCPFYPRCSYRQAVCQSSPPPLLEISFEHFSACHFASELKKKEALLVE